MDPDSGGPKTYGSGFGSATLLLTILYRIRYDASSHLKLYDGSPDLVLLGANNIQEPVQLNKESQ
jgi:hypothetical protein